MKACISSFQGVATQSSVDQAISRLYELVNAKTNADLARKLGIDQSTISSWKARGRVPKRFVDFLDAGEVGQPQIQVELQERAQTIALARSTLLRREVASSGDVDKALAEFMDLKPFWLVMKPAAQELRLKMETLQLDLQTAQALLLNEDLRYPDATEQRVARNLAEDFEDNSWLKDYQK